MTPLNIRSLVCFVNFLCVVCVFLEWGPVVQKVESTIDRRGEVVPRTEMACEEVE